MLCRFLTAKLTKQTDQVSRLGCGWSSWPAVWVSQASRSSQPNRVKVARTRALATLAARPAKEATWLRSPLGCLGWESWPAVSVSRVSMWSRPRLEVAGARIMAIS